MKNVKKIKRLSEIIERDRENGIFWSPGHWSDPDQGREAHDQYEKISLVANKTGVIVRKLNEIIDAINEIKSLP